MTLQKARVKRDVCVCVVTGGPVSLITGVMDTSRVKTVLEWFTAVSGMTFTVMSCTVSSVRRREMNVSMFMCVFVAVSARLMTLFCSSQLCEDLQM